MTDPIGVDTSVAVPLLMSSHLSHAAVSRWSVGRELVLCGHAVAETYSVLTRLPGDARYAPADAARLIGARFGAPLLLSGKAMKILPKTLSELGIAGGAVYDALVALAAVGNNTDLATRDGRARGTYEAVGARVILVH